MASLLDRLDTAGGNLVEAVINRHHRRRLRRNGHLGTLSGVGGFSTQGTPVRAANAVEVHIDGEAALPAMVEAIRDARHSVLIAGWCLTPSFAMLRGSERLTVRELLAEAAEQVEVRVLLWAGPPLPFFHPHRSEVRAARDELVRGTRIRCALDAHNRPMHCHHEKLIVIDGNRAFVGGIDLTDLEGDRFDTAPHPRGTTLGWHDAAASLHGPAVGDVGAHIAMRWEAVTGERLDPGPGTGGGGGDTRVQVVRTVPDHTYPALERGEFGILEAYTGALRGARRLIYIENQFLWSPEISAILRGLLTDPPSPEFRLCIVLPARPASGGDDTRGQLATLVAVDAHRRLLMGTVGGPPGGPPVYVHAKVAVVDDTWLTLGSANLNEHSLFNDTEVNLVTDNADLARGVRERLWSEHLGEECTGRAPLDVIEESWRPAVSGRGLQQRALRPLALKSRRTARLLGSLEELLVDG